MRAERGGREGGREGGKEGRNEDGRVVWLNRSVASPVSWRTYSKAAYFTSEREERRDRERGREGGGWGGGVATLVTIKIKTPRKKSFSVSILQFCSFII